MERDTGILPLAASRPRHRPGAQRGSDRYSLAFLEARTGVAVAHRRLGSSSSATTSTSDRVPDDLRLYDLRHTAASLMIREGASVKAAQKQLGHATASITLDVYGHLFPDELDALAGRLERARSEALTELARTQRGPAVVSLREGAGR
jgi:integrase